MSIKVKICGITNPEDGLFAANAGADMLGLNFYPKSKRYIEPDSARELVDILRRELGPRCPLLVGVFVNTTGDDLRRIMETVDLDFAQLSGDEEPQDLADLSGSGFKALRAPSIAALEQDIARFLPHLPLDTRAPGLLLDAYQPGEYGGTGHQTSDDIARTAKANIPRLMLAGGLRPDNIVKRVRSVQPWGVDVASGVESGRPGIKDPDKVSAFIQAARTADGIEETRG
jgi:phosphoribosylanthranilate isomerase